MSFKGVIGEVVETGKSVDVFSIEWSIPDFLSLAGEGGDRYQSPFFDICGGRWCLKICPNGLWRDPPSAWVSLVLIRTDEGPPQTLDVTLGIRGAEGVENKRGRRQEFWRKDDPVCFWCGFCSRSKLRQHNSKLMPGNVFILSLDMKNVVPSVARGIPPYQDASIQTDGQFRESGALPGESQTLDKEDASTQTDTEFKEARVPVDGKQSSEKQGIEKVVEDMGKLLVSGKKSDITVQVKETEFKVHGSILCARSPVLSAMLEHDTAERVSNKICIDDCDPEVFEEYLRYIYMGSVQSLSQETVFGLYTVADKYLADDLKLLCLEHIQNTLCVRTFCEAMKLALTHGESGLLRRAIDFASKNFQSIIMSVEWQRFICEYPMEANEILIKCFGPRR